MKDPLAAGVPLMVIISAAQLAVTPAGSPEAVPMPVAPVVAWVMLVRAVLMHKVGEADAAPAVLNASTVMAPVASTSPQPPVSGME